MAKRVLAGIIAPAKAPCVKSGKTDHVYIVKIGDFTYPLHMTEICKEVDNAYHRSSSGQNAGESKPPVSSRS